jgi:hypothetical protein
MTAVKQFSGTRAAVAPRPAASELLLPMRAVDAPSLQICVALLRLA